MKDRINKILHALNENLYEREEVVQLSFLATISGESIFLLGLPGVAKSLVARRLKEIFRDGKSFEYLMNRFSTPDEIFGPIAISKLKNEDKYERITENYLPEADIVFLDEIWKAGPSIQNSLLTVINEKIYRNGHQEVKIPLKGLISASNELPAKGEGLEALWDRFIIRCLVENITDAKSFNEFLSEEIIGFHVNLPNDLKITNEEYHKWQESISKVDISDEALNVINVIRNYIARHNKKKDTKIPIYVSDRRWKKIVRILKTSAFLNERSVIDLMDCFLIAYTLWNEVEQIEVVKEFVTDAIKNHGYSLKYNLSIFTREIEDLALDIKNQTQHTNKITYYEPKPVIIDKKIFYEIQDKESFKFSTDYTLNLVKKTDFDNLKKRKYDKITLYNNKGENSSYHSGRHEAKWHSETKIIIRDKYNNDKGIIYDLIEDRKSKNVTETKRPHNAIILDWDKTVSRVSKEIDKTIKEIENFKQTDLASLKENIFVNKNLASIAEHNLNQTIKSLVSEKQKLEKLKTEYDAVL